MRSLSFYSISLSLNPRLSNMSKLHFLHDPFPDNHDGFDYAPKSISDVINEDRNESEVRSNERAQNKMLSMFASIFK